MKELKPGDRCKAYGRTYEGSDYCNGTKMTVTNYAPEYAELVCVKDTDGTYQFHRRQLVPLKKRKRIWVAIKANGDSCVYNSEIAAANMNRSSHAVTEYVEVRKKRAE